MMPTVVDKREDERFASHVPIIFSRFGSGFHREFGARTFNHSKNGLCFDTAEEIKPGTTLWIRRKITRTDEGGEENRIHLRVSSLGEVRWCRELVDKFGSYYIVGVKYF
jgi:hypothetical protein